MDVCARVYVCMGVCVQGCMCAMVYMCMCMGVCVQGCVCRGVCVHGCMGVCVHMCVSVYGCVLYSVQCAVLPVQMINQRRTPNQREEKKVLKRCTKLPSVHSSMLCV